MKTKLLTLLGAVAVFVAVSFADEIIKTNLPATITVNVSTNVLNGDNSSGCSMCFDNYGNHRGSYPLVYGGEPCKPYHPPTERWTTTNVVRRVAVATEWNGKPLTYVEETILSSTTNKWTLRSEWAKDESSRQ